MPTTVTNVPFVTRYYTQNKPWSYDFTVPLVRSPSIRYNPDPPDPNLEMLVYYNGLQISPTRSLRSDGYLKRPLNFSSSFRLMQPPIAAVVTLNIPQARTEDKGIYEVVFRFRPGSDWTDLDCCPQNHRLLRTEQGLGLEFFVVGTAVVQLKLSSECAALCRAPLSS